MCVFCDKIEKERVLFSTPQWMAIYDAFPVSKGHVLLIPKQHVKDYFELPNALKEGIHYRIEDVKRALDEKFKPDGYNIGFNCGEAAGQTVMHFHVHIIPRYNGDIDNPRGGVRGCIPSMMHY